MIYFDYAATTPLHPEVMMTYKRLLDESFVNQDALYKPAIELSRLYEQSKIQLLKLLQLSHHDVIYTSGATEANNLAIKGIAFKYLNQSKHIITTSLEHPSVLSVMKQMEHYGFEVTYLECSSNGVISVEQVQEALRPNTILVSIMAVNNETGIIFPVEEIARMLQSYEGVHFHVDAVQALGKLNIKYDLIDLITFSQHKIHGLKGSGCLIKKKRIVLEPQIVGGQQEYGLRGGTVDAIRHLLFPKVLRLMLEQKQSVLELNHYLISKLSLISSIRIHEFYKSSPYIVSLSCYGYRSQVVIQALSNLDICCSSKSSCSSKKDESHVLNALFDDEVDRLGTIRISIDSLTTKTEIDTLCKGLEHVLSQIKKEDIS